MTVQICLLTTFFFMAEQLRNVSAMDAVCALHHISTSGLLALGVYIYTYDYACFRRRRGGILVAKAATKSRSSYPPQPIPIFAKSPSRPAMYKN